MTKLPPVEKVYEAWSAIADGRVQLQGDDQARVTSSNGENVYTVRHDAATDTYCSNDNATYWRGYAGYPVIAVMMLRGALPCDMAEAKQWAQVNWHQLNDKYKRDYAAAVHEVERERGIDAAQAAEKAQAVVDTLAALPIKVKRLALPKV